MFLYITGDLPIVYRSQPNGKFHIKSVFFSSSNLLIFFQFRFMLQKLAYIGVEIIILSPQLKILKLNY